MPPTRGRHLEPFLGGGAVLLGRLHARQVRRVLATDLNPRLIHVWQSVAEQPDELADELDRLPSSPSRPAYLRLREEFNTRGDDDVSARQAALFIWLNRAGFNGLYRVNGAGGYNVPYGDGAPLRLPSRPQLRRMARLLEETWFDCVDYTTALDRAQPGDQVFADPPYVAGDGAADFDAYTAGGFSLELHTQLADQLAEVAARGCLVVVTNRGTPEAVELYRSRGATVIPTRVRHSVAASGEARRAVPEIMGVWR